MKENSLLQRCRSVDFSAESKNREKNLAGLKTKIEGVEPKMKKFKKPVALMAAVIAVFALSVGALAAAGSPVWRQIEARIIHSDGSKGELEMWTLEDDDYTMTIIRMDVNASEMSDGDVFFETVTEDGEVTVTQMPDITRFDDLDEALSHFLLENVLLPTYLPEGFEFSNASFTVCPISNPGNYRARKNIFLHYGNGQRTLSLNITYIPTDMEVPGEISFDEIKVIDGTTIAIRHLSRHIDGIAYIFSSTGEDAVDYATLERIADSLR